VHTNGLQATCKEDLSAWTSIEGNLSDFRNFDISVIQRSTLGPMLFLCYINDFMVMYCYVLRVILFADDTTDTTSLNAENSKNNALKWIDINSFAGKD
jgi:hypothetical protein